MNQIFSSLSDKSLEQKSLGRKIHNLTFFYFKNNSKSHVCWLLVLSICASFIIERAEKEEIKNRSWAKL
jgi:hypothetical protein